MDYFLLWEQGKGPGQMHQAARKLCRHKGSEIRRELCPGCRGKVEIKVFTCSIHTECTLGMKIDGIACCDTCNEYESEMDAQE
jgi:hypothetical protein